MATIADLKTELATVREQKQDVIKTGKSYQVVSGHSVVNHSLSDLEQQEQLLIKRILRKAGYKTTTL